MGVGLTRGIAACLPGALLAIAGTALAASAGTQRVSVTPSGGETNQPSYSPAVSADGRFVAYFSSATNIIPGVGGGHNQSDVYLYDRQTGTTRLVSESSAGVAGDGYSYEPAISANGRYVAFSSQAHNLVPDDRNRSEAVYWHDMKTGKTHRVDVNSKGKQANGDSASPSISNDGDVLTFSSSATNLTPAKPKASRNEYVHDMKTGRTVQVNVSPTGKPGNGECHKPSVSANGRLIAFASRGTNLVKGRSTGWQIFVRDLMTKKTVVASLSSSGRVGDGLSSHPVISGDGRYVAFESKATNLVKGDTNNALRRLPPRPDQGQDDAGQRHGVTGVRRTG